MFLLLKILASLVLLAVVIGGLVYFLPYDIKVKTVEKLTGILPDSLKNKIQDLVLTPPEKRARLIAQLQNNLTDLKTAAAEEKTKLLSQSEDLIAQLQEKNNDESLVQIIENKLVDKLLGQATTTASQCPK